MSITITQKFGEGGFTSFRIFRNKTLWGREEHFQRLLTSYSRSQVCLSREKLEGIIKEKFQEVISEKTPSEVEDLYCRIDILIQEYGKAPTIQMDLKKIESWKKQTNRDKQEKTKIGHSWQFLRQWPFDGTKLPLYADAIFLSRKIANFYSLPLEEISLACLGGAGEFLESTSANLVFIFNKEEFVFPQEKIPKTIFQGITQKIFQEFLEKEGKVWHKKVIPYSDLKKTVSLLGLNAVEGIFAFSSLDGKKLATPFEIIEKFKKFLEKKALPLF